MPQAIYITQMPTHGREGFFLCHNHYDHTSDQQPGDGGFRVWWSKGGIPENFIPCDCGWSGLPHYHLNKTAAWKK